MGRRRGAAVGGVCHLGMVLLLLALPLVYPGFGRLYLAGIAAIAGCWSTSTAWSAPTTSPA